jgi:flagellar export protein FliJ
MKSLHTLLKVAQRKLDELAVESARITQELGALNDREASIRAREQSEIASTAQDPTFASMLPAYRLRVKWQIDEVRVQVAAKEKLLEETRERLSACYIEKSKFEQLIEQGRVRDESERATREQAQLDEVAINRAGGQGK